MARNLDTILDALPPERRAVVEHRAAELSTLKDLRQVRLLMPSPEKIK